MLNLSSNEMFLLLALSGVLNLISFMCGMFLERRKWLKIFRAAINYRKGVIDISTSRATDALARMGFTVENAVKGLQDLGEGRRGAYPPVRRRGSGKFPGPPLPPPPGWKK